jgi:putative transposase
MSDYRRAIVPGGTFFLTLVTYRRTPLFSESENVFRLRVAVAQMLTERPFEIIGAVVLPEHIHFLWRLPPNDSDYSQRVSRLKVLFTRSLRGYRALPQTVSASRHKHRESDVWQRRFWEHTIRDEVDLQRHLDYLH